ncbi:MULTISPECIES: thiamine phosphate synthase [unclassified Hyphomonas]|jgi:thiamine-phosphate pyrophosphorylase|uniref:thiamine phosphate synthase n=1 Tax=unclassified Hyphomonas TaxID=2630699 RepID=UPI000C53E427|nr:MULTISPECIES: thiamine phosphate synthase [unclassified Hyphomonas]MAL44735.1 thiamine phosphate synthase [Hyphomonas sp.]MAX84045.1 thiamine phosphate synthase [Hyphomonas sp.]MBG66551.1 thiamine phosphate synthase [Hyphomonas sp.]MBO6584227.1 thiamine phosphate synthase [Hyphomonas sp.]RCL90189.1 MAG: thiamine phosphate synthase [Hyphomonas sp.]|tara:strand:- start:5293 stop:5973 length:681 start_codon:yes stop_codon:yes gene_type:complete
MSKTEDYVRPRTRLYLITPPRIEDVEGFAALLETALSAGDVACLQLRLKADTGEIDVDATRAVGAAVTEMAQAYGVAVLVNDSAELAVEIGADGVHVGMDDMPVKKAREIVGPDMIVGATAKNSRHAAMQACEAGADYVAFGAFFPTRTKTGTVEANPDLLEIWQESMEVPCVAIGGITVENAEPLAVAGADFLAVSSGVWDHPEGAPVAIAHFNALLDRLDASKA